MYLRLIGTEEIYDPAVDFPVELDAFIDIHFVAWTIPKHILGRFHPFKMLLNI